MSLTLFAGCSYTKGAGWADEDKDQNLWTNILHSSNQYLKHTTSVNLSQTGISNSKIFKIAVDGLVTYRPQYAFVQWTSYPRYNILLSVETYASTMIMGPGVAVFDYNLHDVTYPRDYLQNINDRFLTLHHPHQGIAEIVEYVNTLIKLAEQIDCKIFFINGICPWDDNYFEKLENTTPSNYTEFTRKCLHTETRSDQEVFQLYEKIHSEYKELGSIQAKHWLNLYQSMYQNLVDVNLDNVHPGKNSNIFYADLFNQQLNHKLSS